MNNKAILESYLSVPAHLVPLEALEEFRITLKDREGDSYDRDFFAYDPATDMYKFERGNLELIRKTFKDIEIEDRRSVVPMMCNDIVTDQGDRGLKLTAKLRPGFTDSSGKYRNGQEDVAREIVNGDGFGQVKAPPRFGKTITMIGITAQLQQKTLFLSHQEDLAEQVYSSIINFTNILDLEYKAEKQIAGIVKDWKDLDEWDICIMPYQKFVSGKNAEEMLRKYKNRFGVVWVDEAHKGKAERYSVIISSWNARYRLGVSGTTELKGDYHLINDYTLGPVVIKGYAKQIPCTVHTVETKTKVPYKVSKLFFTQACSYLAKNLERNKIVLDILYQWAQAGHYIIAVSDRTGQIDSLTKELTNAGIKAESFHAKRFTKTKVGKKKREECLNRMRKGEIQVLNAMRSMVLGLDIPRATTFVNIQPTSHPQNYYQEYCRVRTPFEENGYKKEMAYIIDLVDDHSFLKNCYLSRRKLYKEEKFVINDNFEENDVLRQI